MTQRHPQLLITLSLQGGLVLELPGSMGTRRQVQVRDGELASTCHRILAAQLLEQTEIGLDGAPTQAQVKHWERHGIWADSQCRFCLSEGRAHASRPKTRRKVLVSVDRAGVEVRRIKTGLSSAPKTKKISSKKSAEELGL